MAAASGVDQSHLLHASWRLETDCQTDYNQRLHDQQRSSCKIDTHNVQDYMELQQHVVNRHAPAVHEHEESYLSA